MKEPYRILVVDDQSMSRKLLTDLLSAHDYVVTEASGGREALAKIREEPPDLVLLDVLMPDMDGYEVCGAIRDQPAGKVLPIVMVTALDASEERIRGLEAGADDFLSKPINRPELIARVKSLLRIKSLYDLVQSQADELATLNAGLENRVQEQLAQLGRLTQLKRFFPPQLAEQIVSGDLDDPMQTRRREVTVVVLGLRGFNAFADTSEPEEVMRLLRSFHSEMGRMIEARGGTLEQFTGSSMIVIFNDPVMVDDPALRAVVMVVEMQKSFSDLMSEWSKRGFEFALGAGISHGFATIGAIGDEERASYGVIGRVTNVASRLCEEANAGEILISTSVKALTEDSIDVAEVEQVNMAGFARAVSVYRVMGITARTQPAVKREWPLKIHTLGRFSVEVNGQPLKFSRKVQKKPLDMLRVLVAYGGVRVEASTIIEHLWPGAEGDAGKVSFDSNLHRLRKLIDVEDLLLMSEGKLSLDPAKCWIDVVALDDVVSRVEQDANASDGKIDETAVPLMKELLQLYSGHFLDGESQEAWVIAARDRWKAKFIRAVALIGKTFEERQEWEMAAALFSRALELDNLAEALYRRLMNCYIELGEPAEALNSYRRCRDMLSIVLGVKPSPETEAVREMLGQAEA
jgi:adenylate cyclase